MPENEESARKPFDEETDPDGYKLTDVLPEDYFLDAFTDIDGKGLGVGIVLNCGGVVVSGVIIGYREYVEKTAELVADAWGKERDPESGQEVSRGAAAGEALSRLWSPYVDDFDRKKQEREAAGLVPPTPRFVHMRDVTIFVGPGVNASLWRCPIASISGWSLGSVDSSAS